WHRGPTHGPLGVVGLGLVTASLVWGWRRLRARRAGRTAASAAAAREASAVGAPTAPRGDPSPSVDASFPMLVAIAMIGVVFHILMDLPTSYGTRLLSPFSWRWFAVDWMPIIDIYLLMVLVAALGFGRTTPAINRRKAAIVLTFMAANYGVR